jgi:hypothetical protein
MMRETRRLFSSPSIARDPALYGNRSKTAGESSSPTPVEELIGGQLRAGFTLTDIYSATNDSGNFRDHNIPTFYATRTVKP